MRIRAIAMGRLAALVTLVCLWNAGGVDASLVSADWNSANDGLLTHDTVTSNYWLDLTETAGMSYNDVIAQFGPGGSFEGFRVATYDEVTELLLNAGIAMTISPTINPGQSIYDSYTSFIELLGATYESSGPYPVEQKYNIGIVDPLTYPIPPPQDLVGGVLVSASTTNDAPAVYNQTVFAGQSFWYSVSGTPPSSVGVYLILESSSLTTPEPATLTMVGFAGIGLAMGALRKRRRQERSKDGQTVA